MDVWVAIKRVWTEDLAALAAPKPSAALAPPATPAAYASAVAHVPSDALAAQAQCCGCKSRVGWDVRFAEQG